MAWPLMLCGCFVVGAHAQTVTLPINQTVLPDGQIRYSIPIAIADQPPFEAMLDTGSVGLRILATAIPAHIKRTLQGPATSTPYGYASGELFDGIDTHASIDIGRRGDVPFQLVNEVSCSDDKPTCTASKLNALDYRIGSNGYRQLGLGAIIGVGPARVDGSGLPNPLSALGFTSWTIELPLPNAAAPGRLTLYRGAMPREGFLLLPNDALGQVPGCLIAEDQQHVCGPMLMDTGAFGITIYQPDISTWRTWRAGMKARLSFSGSEVPPIGFVTGFNGTYEGVSKRPAEKRRNALIVSGVIAYFHYVILYNAQGRVVAASARD